MDKAGLIIKVAGHLHGFLPGQDHKEAISRLVSSRLSWYGAGGSGQVSRAGIGHWETTAAAFAGKRSEALLFVTWKEVLAIIEAGCADGYREAFEKARAEWGAAVDAARKGEGGPDPWAAEGGLYAARDALIRHGCEVSEPMVLF